MVAPTTYLTSDISGSQLVLNNGFENVTANDFDDWTEADLVYDETGSVHSGSHAVKMTYTGAGLSRVRSEVNISVSTSTRYVLTFWTRGDGTEQGRYAVSNVTDASWLINITDTGVTGTSYTQVRVYFTTTGTCVNILLHLYAPDATGDAYFDDVSLYEGQIETEHNNLSNNDYVLMKAAPGGIAQIEVFQIKSAAGGSGPYTYDVERAVDGTPANTWYAGDAVANLGYAAGEGYIELTSTSTVHNDLGPSILVYARTATTNWNSSDPIVVMGNLENLIDYSGPDEFGFATGNDLDLTPSTGFKGVAIDRTNGARLFNVDLELYNGATQTVDIQSDGDAFFGSNVAAPATTSLAILANAQVYNSETFGAGDILFGDNSTSPAKRANIWWDSSAGRLYFRGGLTAQMYLDTDGTLVAGGGKVQLDNVGLRFQTQAGGHTAGLIRFEDNDNDVVSYMYGYDSGTQYLTGIEVRKDLIDSGYDAAINFTIRDDDTLEHLGFLALYDYSSSLAIAEIRISAIPGTTGELRITGTGIADILYWFQDNGTVIFDQQGADTVALEIRNDDVTHGMTSPTDTNTYFDILKTENIAGGALLRGWKDSEGVAGRALSLQGLLGKAADTDKDTGAVGVVDIGAYIKSGTSVTSVGANGNLVVIRNKTTTRFIFDAEGDAHADVEWKLFDEYDDIALLTALEHHAVANGDPIKEEFGEFLEYNKDALEEMKLAHFEDDRPGHAMVNFTRLSMLLTGAVKQLNDRLGRYERALVELGADPKLLN